MSQNRRKRTVRFRQTPTNTTKTTNRDWIKVKVVVCSVAIALCLIGLWFRAFDVQIIKGSYYAEKAARQFSTVELIPGVRGEIVDRNGRLLAKSVRVQSLACRPVEIKKYIAENPDIKIHDIATKIAKILQMDPQEIETRLIRDKSFVWLARKISDKQSQEIKKLDFPGILLLADNLRTYPNGHLAGQLLGYVGIDGNGLDGLEKSFDDYLTGRQEKLLVQRDATGRKLLMDVDDDLLFGKKGNILSLTIDSNIQFQLEESLAKATNKSDAKRGMGIVLDARSGEILAWSIYPFFNPNRANKYSGATKKNILALDAYDPGSTLKPLVMAAALQEGVITPESMQFCENGKWEIDNNRVRDSSPHGWLSARKILQYSSNIGMGKIGRILGAKKMYEYFKKLGLTEKTGLPLPGESRGIVRPGSKWRTIDLATISFGQGISISPVQLVQAVLCLANKGVLKKLQLVEGLEEETTQSDEVHVFSEDVALQVMRMLEGAVTEGTGKQAQIDGVSVAGKTGTAQKAFSTGYGKVYMSSFIGFIPAKNPEYLIFIMLDEPKNGYYASTVAAPVFKEVGTYIWNTKFNHVKPTVITAMDNSFLNAYAEDFFNGSTTNVEAVISDTDKMPDLSRVPIQKAILILAKIGIVAQLHGEGGVVVSQKPQVGYVWKKNENRTSQIWLSE